MAIEKTLLDEILEQTINFTDENNQPVKLRAGDVYRAYCPAKATPEQLLEFKMKVEALGLDPRRSEVWMSIMDEREKQGDKYVKVGEKVVILTNYMVYLKRAWASGKLDWFHVEIEKPNETNTDTWKAKFTGQRIGATKQFETDWIPVRELNKKRNVWNVMPTVMTQVRMTALGLRWMMADVLGAMPYTAEEMTGGLAEIDDRSLRIENFETDEKQKADMERERESLDQEKQKALDKIRAELAKANTRDEIEKRLAKTKLSDKFKQSAMKDDILAVYRERIEQIDNEQANLNIATISTKTKMTYNEVEEWYNAIGHLIDVPTAELLEGNDDAIATVKGNIIDFLKLQAETVEEPDLAELGEGEAELNL